MCLDLYEGWEDLQVAWTLGDEGVIETTAEAFMFYLRALDDIPEETAHVHAKNFHKKVHALLDPITHLSWLVWCEELLSPGQAASMPGTSAMEVDADGEPKDDKSVHHFDQDKLADDEEASADDSSPTPSAKAIRPSSARCQSSWLRRRLPLLPRDSRKEPGKKEPARASHILKIPPCHFNLVTPHTFKRAHIDDSEPKSEHFHMLPEEPEVTTSSKMKSSKGKKRAKGSAVTSLSKLATTDEFLATITAEHDELQMCLSVTMSQFDLLLQDLQKMITDNHKFLGRKQLNLSVSRRRTGTVMPLGLVTACFCMLYLMFCFSAHMEQCTHHLWLQNLCCLFETIDMT
ncbi:uncharacterized protein LAESUDRAFT_715799 [Laetiporus sulphureus 93-53]|uniref:Uncharacterized protein n=1 Tax=Laetiporus sulphureus 93-53 TaxID=1314785 RepID=A0A165D3D1_9APHY|nr:uncharacterized protein LAESUDRAFT_715799 [Laetiporus sulphureus 93-53]KZT04079.1 hypothetical protein LAESUDRAFT_715799 [Laetiporus sulphureus 93-53]